MKVGDYVVIKFIDVNERRALCSVAAVVDDPTATAYVCVDAHGVREIPPTVHLE